MDYNTLDDLAVTGKRVLVRADLNVPLKDGVVTVVGLLLGCVMVRVGAMESGGV